MSPSANRWLKPRHKSAAGIFTGRLRASLGALALVGRILQRYRLRGQPPRGLGIQYLQANRLTGLPQALRLSLLLTQRLENAARPPQKMRLPAANHTPPAAYAQTGSAAMQAATAPSPLKSGTQRGSPVYLQAASRVILTSHQRVELTPSNAPLRQAAPLAAAGVEAQLIRPLSLVPRPAAVIARGTAAASSPQQDAAHRTSPFERQPNSSQTLERAASGLPPTELRRVTEQVIQEIDKRIIANRERFGRT